MAVDFSLLTGLVSNAMPVILVSLLGVFLTVVSVGVIVKGIGLLLEAVQGDTVKYGGHRWDKAVWQEAMNDLNRQKRSGVLLDSESLAAMRHHQGLGDK